MVTCRATQSVDSECSQVPNPALPYTEAWGSQAPNFQQGYQQGTHECKQAGCSLEHSLNRENEMGWVGLGVR